MGIWYKYDSVEKDVLIRYVEDNQFHEILHKGDKAWRALYPQPNDNDELYTTCAPVKLYQGPGINY